jgi:hypothetical protein
VFFVRRFILTADDRRRLVLWIRSGEEDQVTRNLFSVIREGFPQLVRDMKLLILVRRRLSSQGRWRGRVRVPSDFRDYLLRGGKDKK